MTAPLRIVTYHLSLSEAIRELIRLRAEHLGQFCCRIVDCQVVVEGPERPQDGGLPYRVRIDLGLYGKPLLISRQQGELLEVVVQAAFQAAERRLESLGCRSPAVAGSEQQPPDA